MAEIFVFGSNLLGIHKKGAALCALNHHGAILGQGIGLQGNSYAIPTKHTPRKSLSLVEINKHVADFLVYAMCTSENIYLVTKIGCGLAGFQVHHIAPMFKFVIALPNVKVPEEFVRFIPGLSGITNSTTTFSGY